MNARKQRALGATLSYASIVFNILAGLIYTPWMIECIGRSDYGLYSTATAFLSYFTIDLGLGSALSRFVSKYRAEGNEVAIERLLGIVYKFYLILDIVILICILIAYACIQQIFVKFNPLELANFKNIFLILGAYTLISFPCSTFSGLLAAHERFFTLKATGLMSKVIIVACMVVALSMGYGLYALVLVNVLVHLLIYIIRYAYLKKSVHIKILWKYFDWNMVKEVFAFSVWTLLISLASRFIFNIEPTIIAALAGTQEVSLFAVGNTIEGYVWMFANALNSLFLAKMSRIVVSDGDDRKQINMLMQRVGRVQLIVVGAIVFVFVSMGYEFVHLWLNEEFQVSYYITVFMILPSLVLRTQDIANTLILVENKLKYQAIVYVVQAVVSVALSLALVPTFGAIGAGIAIFVCMVLAQIVVMHFVYTRVMHLDMWNFYKNCHLKMLVPGIVCMSVGFALQYFWPSTNLLYFIVKGIVVVAVYVLAVLIFFVNADEKAMFARMVKKLRKK